MLRCEDLGESTAATQADGPRQMHEVLPVNRRLSLEVHDNNASHYLSYIGNVIGFKDGGIEVKWASRLVSKIGGFILGSNEHMMIAVSVLFKVKPSEVFGLDIFDVSDLTPVCGNEVAEENVGKESEHDKQSWHEKEVDLPENCMNDSGEDCKKDLVG